MGWFVRLVGPAALECRYYESNCLAPQGEDELIFIAAGAVGFRVDLFISFINQFFFFIGSLSSLFHQSTVEADD